MDCSGSEAWSLQPCTSEFKSPLQPLPICVAGRQAPIRLWRPLARHGNFDGSEWSVVHVAAREIEAGALFDDHLEDRRRRNLGLVLGVRTS